MGDDVEPLPIDDEPLPIDDDPNVHRHVMIQNEVYYNTSVYPPVTADKIRQLLVAPIKPDDSIILFDWDGVRNADEMVQIGEAIGNTPRIKMHRCSNINAFVSYICQVPRIVELFHCSFNEDAQFTGIVENLITCQLYVADERIFRDGVMTVAGDGLRYIYLLNTLRFFPKNTRLSIGAFLATFPLTVAAEMKTHQNISKLDLEVYDVDLASIFGIKSKTIVLKPMGTVTCTSTTETYLAPIVDIHLIAPIFHVSAYEAVLGFLNLLKTVRVNTRVIIHWKYKYPSIEWLKRVHRAIIQIPERVNLQFMVPSTVSKYFNQYEIDRQFANGLVATRTKVTDKSQIGHFLNQDGDLALATRVAGMNSIKELDYRELEDLYRDFPPPRAHDAVVRAPGATHRSRTKSRGPNAY